MNYINTLFLVFTAFTLAGCGGGDSAEENTTIIFNSAPTLSGEPENAFVGAAFKFAPQLEDKDNDPITLSANNLPSWLTLNDNVLRGTPSKTDLGSITFELIVSDGKATSTYRFSLQVIDSQETNTAPSISGQIPTAYVGVGFSFTPSVIDKENDVLSFAIENAPSWTDFDITNAHLSGTPTKQDLGTYQNITISVNDGINKVEFNFDITVKEGLTVNTPPQIRVINQSAVINAEFTYTPNITDAQNDVLAMAINNAPAWLNFNTNTGEVSGTPTIEHVGLHSNIKITVSDGEYSNNGIFDITVVNPDANNTAPVIIGTPTKAYVNTAYSYSFEISDKENDPLSYHIENLPNWLSFDEEGSTLSGTPTNENIGTHNNIKLTVSDSKLETVHTFSVSVVANEPINTPPVISGTPANAEENKAYSFIPTASDADGDTLRFSAKNLPSWASFSTINGEISGTPSANDIGTFENIEITV
uniref:putative Ig domain-containing protein n=1 Tax=Pseudoalteromonas sp. TaxID=53249 RepID=UPI0035665318